MSEIDSPQGEQAAEDLTLQAGSERDAQVEADRRMQEGDHGQMECETASALLVVALGASAGGVSAAAAVL